MSSFTQPPAEKDLNIFVYFLFAIYSERSEHYFLLAISLFQETADVIRGC